MSGGDRTARLRIDVAAECIWRDGEKIGVAPKAFLVLRCLMARPGELVTKQELLQTVWPDTYVTDTVLNNAVGQLRQALGDNPKRPAFIETVHRRGFRWIGPRADAPAAPSPGAADGAPDVDTPDRFVGRAAALAELERCYARAGAGQRQLVLVSGEPGIGKTALVERFVARLAQRAHADPRPTLVARGQSVESYGAGDPYRPLREAAEDLLRRGGDGVRAVFRSHAPSWLLSMPELATADELESLRRGVRSSTIESVQRELERVLEAVSADRTLLLVLEDLHWCEPATVAVLWALATRREPARLLIVGTYRPADAIAQQHPLTRLHRELGAKRLCVDLALDGLPGEAVGAFLDRRFPGHALSEAFAARLCEQTAGNPLFLLNALDDLERRGWLREQEGAWRCAVDLDRLFAAVPESTRELIAFRFEQLGPAAREVLEAASVVGETFATQAVAAAVERDGAEVERELEPLARAERFLRRGEEVEWPDGRRGGEHTFRHALYRQVLLRGITPSRRQQLHRRVALALEQAYGDRAGEVAAALSLHHEQAGDVARAVDYIELLVQQAYARSAAHEAEALLAHAVQLLRRTHSGGAPSTRLLKLAIAHAIALSSTRGGASAEALRALQAARALGQSMPASLEHIASMGTLVAGSIMRGQVREARGIAEEMLALAGADAAPRALVTAHASAGSSLLYAGEIDAAVRELERAMAAVAAIADSPSEPPMPGFDPLIPAYVFHGFAAIIAGRPQTGRAAIEAAVQRARAADMPWYLGFVMSIASALAMVRRDVAETRALASAALAYGAEQNLPLWKVPTQGLLGWSEVMAGGGAEGLEPLRQRVDRFRASGHIAVSHTYSALTDAWLSVGRIDDAASALDAAFATRGEERLWDAELFRLRGALWAARARANGSDPRALGEAERCFEQAIEIARAQGAKLFGLRATVDRGRLWIAAAKREQAHAALRDALGGFDEGFDEPDLRAARQLRDELEGGPRPAPRRRQ